MGERGWREDKSRAGQSCSLDYNWVLPRTNEKRRGLDRSGEYRCTPATLLNLASRLLAFPPGSQESVIPLVVSLQEYPFVAFKEFYWDTILSWGHPLGAWITEVRWSNTDQVSDTGHTSRASFRGLWVSQEHAIKPLMHKSLYKIPCKRGISWHLSSIHQCYYVPLIWFPLLFLLFKLSLNRNTKIYWASVSHLSCSTGHLSLFRRSLNWANALGMSSCLSFLSQASYLTLL